MFGLALAKDLDEAIRQLDSERAARLLAEANARNLLERLNEKTAFAERVSDEAGRERKRHADDLRDMLDRFAPKVDFSAVADQPAPRQQRPYTSEQARQQRAIGKLGLEFRNREVHNLEVEEREQADGADVRRRNSSLTPEEQQGLNVQDKDMLDRMIDSVTPKTQEVGKDG
jgi:hypothetical protein